MSQFKSLALGGIVVSMLLGGCGQVTGTAATTEAFPAVVAQDVQPGSSLGDLVLAKLGHQIQGQPAYLQRIVTHPVTDPTYLAQGYTTGFTAYLSTDPTGKFHNYDQQGVYDQSKQAVEFVSNDDYEGIIAPKDGQWIVEQSQITHPPLQPGQDQVFLTGKDYFGQAVEITAGHYAGSTPTRTGIPSHYDYYGFHAGTFEDGYRHFAPPVMAKLLAGAKLQPGVSPALVQEAIQLVLKSTIY